MTPSTRRLIDRQRQVRPVLFGRTQRQHGHGGVGVELREVARGQVGPEAGFDHLRILSRLADLLISGRADSA